MPLFLRRKMTRRVMHKQKHSLTRRIKLYYLSLADSFKEVVNPDLRRT